MAVAKMQELIEGRRWPLQKCRNSLKVVDELLQNAGTNRRASMSRCKMQEQIDGPR